MPVTHAFYLASALWLLGLAGVLLRRDAWGRVIAATLMLVGAAAVLLGAARAWGSAEIGGLLALALALAGAYGALMAALTRAEGGE